MADTDDMENMLTMDMGVPLFLAIWVAMMVAMMFPTAAPMILTFAKVQQGKQQRGKPYVPTWVFVGAYLAIWTAFGALAYAAALGATELAGNSMWVMDNAARIGGGVLILAGLYQVSPLKNICLSKCRTPWPSSSLRGATATAAHFAWALSTVSTALGAAGSSS
jgi:predicted metal-binding membrane protein